MSDEFDLDWDDSAFEGDIDFDMDFDMDPFKNKGFFSSAAKGFLSQAVDKTIGSTDAAIKTARIALPNTYSTLLDRVDFLNDKAGELVTEFKENNYESVKSLQNIAKNVAKRLETKSEFLSKKMKDFSEKDFSSWEKIDSNREEDIGTIGSLDQEELNSELERLTSNQNESFKNVADSLNEMQAYTAGGIMAAVKTSNRELVGVQASVRELLNYQRNVQYKMDQAKIELLARTYLVNAKYFKFMEKALHTSITELKRITVNTNKSDYEKTSLYNAARSKIRGGALGAIGKRAGGLLGGLSETFGKDGRKGLYGGIGDIIGGIEDMTSMTDGVPMSKGMIGDMVGRIVADRIIENIPKFLNQGPFQKLFDNALAGNPELKNSLTTKWDKLKDFGNTASYGANNGLELLNYYSQYWEDLDESQYADYDDYVEQKTNAGGKPMPRAAFTVLNGLGNQGKSFINRYMNGLSSVSGTKYTIKTRNAESLTQVGQWREINNITLNDVIPGWLSRIYESMEKLRTGNDNFTSPTFSYNRGQFVDKNTAREIVKYDIFDNSSFRATANKSNEIINLIDKENILTEEQRQKLAMTIIRDTDKEFGFNPYYYTGNIEGLDSDSQEVVNKLIKQRFNIDDDMLREYESGDIKTKLKMAALGFKGEDAESLFNISTLSRELKEAFPNIGEKFGNNRQAGNEQILRDLGLIYTENGVDKMNMDVFWNRLNEYVKDPNNPELTGKVGPGNEVNAGATRGFNGSNNPPIPPTPNPIPGETLNSFNEAVEKLNQGVKYLTDNIGKIDFSKVDINLGTMPESIDSLKSIMEKINDRDERKYGLIEQMLSCVCRQAGGWGGKSDEEKKRIERNESEGKKSIMDRLKSISPRGLFNKSIETLINNQPLVLGGIIGGLGTLALHDPKAAALVTGGMAIAGLYGRIKSLSQGETPNDDEDIYDETGTIILHAAKLRTKDYYDTVSKQVIKSWKEIKGAIFDIATKTYTTVAQLTGKLFGPDGRALIIKGLDKVRDTLNKVWNKIDIFGNARKAWDKGKEMFYQQDVYVKGDSEPRLTRSGFMKGKYYCYDRDTKQSILVKGWNEINGPVYELDEEGNLNQIISEAEIAQGLVTSSGVALDKLGKAASWLGGNALSGLLKAKDLALDKAGIVKDKAKDVFRNDYTGIEGRLDRIYYLLCKQFGVEPSVLPTGDGTPPGTPTPSDTSFIDDIVNAGAGNNPTPTHDAEGYPTKIRLNSIKDQEVKEEKHKRDQFYEDIHGIRENMDEGSGKDKEGKDKDKKGIFGKLGMLLGGGAGLLKKLFKNPLGFAFDITGMIFKSMLKSPMRLVNIGSLLFKGVLGTSSAIYKLLGWGFSGLMWGIRKLLWKDTAGSFMDALRGRGKGKRGKGRRGRPRSGGSSGRGRKFGIKGLVKTAVVSAAVGTAFNSFGEDKSSGDVFDQAEGNFDQFYEGSGGSNDSGGDYGDESGLGIGVDDIAFAAATDPLVLSKAANKGITKLSGTKVGASAAEVLGKIGLKGAAKAGLKAVPLLGELLMAYDAAMGFADKDQAAETFGTNYITGKQRAANGIGEALDIGGLGTLGLNKLGDITGIQYLQQDDAFKHLIADGLNLFSKIPVLGHLLDPLSLFDADASTPQRKIRMAMYGIEKTDSELGKNIEIMEKALEPFVDFNGRQAWIRKEAPLAEILKPIIKLDPKETLAWFKMRFEPVFNTWQSGVRLGGFKDLFSYDRDSSAKTYVIAKQIRSAITALKPYPLDVVVTIDPKTPIMPRQRAEAVITGLMAELREKLGDKYDEEGNIKIDNHIRTESEVKEGVSQDTGVWATTRNFFQKMTIGMDESLFKASPQVKEIDISDLHKDENTAVEELTLVRLAVYGNTENKGYNVDTVLKLERYCEQFFVYTSGYAKFTGKIGDIYSLFKPSFRVFNKYEDIWVDWFNKRFLPVMKVWYESIFERRNAAPAKAWVSVSQTDRLNIARKLIDVRTEIDKELHSVWDVETSPFPGTTSGTDPNITTDLIKNLEKKATEAKLKTPDIEAEKSERVNMGDDATNARLSAEDEKRLAEMRGGGNNIWTGNGETNTESANNSTGGVGVTGETNNVGSDSSAFVGGAGNFAGQADEKFNPESLKVTDKGFKVSQKDAEKLIINEFVKQGLTDNRVLAFALANAKAETDFAGKAENMNYRPDAIMRIWPNRFNRSVAERVGFIPGKQQANGPELARYAYGGRYGNNTADDGYKYRGRGFTQLTFKDNYKAVGNIINDPSIVNNPEKVTNDPKTAAATAAGYFKFRPDTIRFAKMGNIEGAAKAVGLEGKGIDRKKSYFSDYLKRLTDGDLKDILSGSANKEEDKKENQEENIVNEAAQVEPEGTNKPVPVTGVNDINAQAASNVNIPPATENSSPSSLGPSAPEMEMPVQEQSPVQTEQPVSTNAVSQPVTPVVQQTPPPPPVVTPQPQKVTLPEGIIKVQDDTVATAIAGLAEAIGRALSTQGPNTRRVSVGPRS